MDCEWGQNDCQNHTKKCHLCTSDSFHYLAPKAKKPTQLAYRAEKPDKRMGSAAEHKNNINNKRLLDGTTARATPNSGAGYIKGDAEIRGLVTVMEEFKTRVVVQAPGKKTFTIEKSWLEKLMRESNEANKQFYYLKFSFHETDPQIFVIIDQDMIMGMIYTMAEDRKKVLVSDSKVEIAQKRAQVIEAENILLKAKLELLEAQLRQTDIGRQL